MSAEQQYIDLYRQYAEQVCLHSSAVMNAGREEAFAHFLRLGFPTRRQEKYKYTDVAKLFEPDYGLNLKRYAIPVNPLEAFKSHVPNLRTTLYFMVNDAFHAQHAPDGLPDGVLIGSLREISEREPALVERYYGKLADASADGITAFNTLFAQDGLFVYVPKNVRVENPVQLVNLLRADSDFLINRRVLIVLEEGASLKLLACDHSMTNVRFLTTQVIEAYVADDASLDLYELEETESNNIRLSNLCLRQGARSRVLLNGMTLNNGITRNTTQVRMEGEEAELNVFGMAISDGRQAVDNNTYVEHASPRCTSNQLYKYVLDDEAVGAFAGLVKVQPGAHHTNSRQTNRNLCVTREARMYTQPQLEIYNDDVKCSHGATVGQLDENALFYMRQRGISLREARLLLMFAFVGEIVDAIRIEPLRERLHQLVELRFRGELSRGCIGCDICKKT